MSLSELFTFKLILVRPTGYHWYWGTDGEDPKSSCEKDFLKYTVKHDELGHFGAFWATVCKTVRPMLSDRCLSCPVCPVCDVVHCGQTVGRIKMKLGMQVGLGPGHIVLGGDPAPLF